MQIYSNGSPEEKGGFIKERRLGKDVCDGSRFFFLGHESIFMHITTTLEPASQSSGIANGEESQAYAVECAVQKARR